MVKRATVRHDRQGTPAGKTGAHAELMMPTCAGHVARFGISSGKVETMKIDKKFIHRYATISTIAFSGWLVYVSFKLIVLAGHFVSSVVTTVVHSIPFTG
jgi:hypothetical protein